MTSSFPIATVFNVVKEIQNQVMLAKANRTLCKRIGSEMEALEPILTDVSNRAQAFTQQQQEIIAKALTMLQKDLESTLELIRCQTKGSDEGTGRALAFKVKRFVMARGVNEQFTDAERNLEAAKSTLMFALLNQLGSQNSQSSGLNMQQAGGPPVQNAPVQSNPVQKSAPTKEDILHLMDSPQYMDAIPMAQQLLREGQSGDAIFANYTLAICNAQAGSAEKAVTYLFAAKQVGFKDFEQLDQEPYFNSIRSHPEFVQLRNQIQEEVLSKERWRRLPQAQVDEIMRIFDQYDLDGSGKIDAKEFDVLMQRTRPELASTSVQIFKSLDLDNSGHISLDEYLNYIADQQLQGNPQPQQMQQLQQPPAMDQQFQQPPQQYQQPMPTEYQPPEYQETDKKDKKRKKEEKKEEKKREKEEKKEKKEKKHK